MSPAVPLILAVAVVPPGSAAPSATAPVELAPISDQALHGCRAGELEKTLRGRLARGKGFHLIRERGDAAVAYASLEIVECTRAEQQKGKFTSKGGPVTGPVQGGRGVARGADGEVSVQTETLRLVVLRGRVVSGDRFLEVASGPKDRSLTEAADTLRRTIDEALEERGGWLFGTKP